MRTLRWVVFGLLYRALEDPVRRKSLRVVGVLVTVVGLTLLSIWLAKLPRALGAIPHAKLTAPIAVGCDKMVTGGTYVIQIDGKRHPCPGADSWCPHASPETRVAYSANAPARCRAAHNVGRLSRWEKGALLSCLCFLLGGTSLLLIREEDSNRLRQVISHGFLLLTVALAVLMIHFQIGPMY